MHTQRKNGLYQGAQMFPCNSGCIEVLGVRLKTTGLAELPQIAQVGNRRDHNKLLLQRLELFLKQLIPKQLESKVKNVAQILVSQYHCIQSGEVKVHLSQKTLQIFSNAGSLGSMSEKHFYGTAIQRLLSVINVLPMCNYYISKTIFVVFSCQKIIRLD